MKGNNCIYEGNVVYCIQKSDKKGARYHVWMGGGLFIYERFYGEPNNWNLN